LFNDVFGELELVEWNRPKLGVLLFDPLLLVELRCSLTMIGGVRRLADGVGGDASTLKDWLQALQDRFDRGFLRLQWSQINISSSGAYL
jgi:hypothetical protein